jgi:hypothetical protein
MRATGMPFSFSKRMLMLAPRDITETASLPWLFADTQSMREAPHWLRTTTNPPDHETHETVQKPPAILSTLPPAATNTPPVLVECPGLACEFLGLEKLRTLFCNAQLSRVDVAFDHTLLAPTDVADWIRAGNVRTRAKRDRLDVKLKGPASEGDKLTIGSRAPEQYLRVYDRRGFTRMELELKGDMARSYREILLAEEEVFLRPTVDVLRHFVDFVDASVSSNISRAPLLSVRAVFTGKLERVRIRVAGAVQPTVDRVAHFIEDQVAATLHVYWRLGNSVECLLRSGRHRLEARHRAVLVVAGAGVG